MSIVARRPAGTGSRRAGRKWHNARARGYGRGTWNQTGCAGWKRGQAGIGDKIHSIASRRGRSQPWLGSLNVTSTMASSGNTTHRLLRCTQSAFLGAFAPTLSFGASSDGQYFLPGEFVACVLFLFLPPLLVSLAAQAWVFLSRGVPDPFFGRRALGSFLLTVLASVALAAAFFVAEPKALAPVLRVRELSFAGGSWPFSPLAFLAVAAVAPFAIWWGSRRAR